MIHHIDFTVTDFARSREFYIRALQPLGLTLVIDKWNGRELSGFGSSPDPEFWIRQGPLVTPRLHVAFTASTHAAVDAFYKTALEAGGSEHGAPGLRPRYVENYYAAYVLDPDGHNIEAVCRFP
jgi:catechol 2,3-dioxygenase-like lactoylglutathione lyase family enzyme